MNDRKWRRWVYELMALSLSVTAMGSTLPGMALQRDPVTAVTRSPQSGGQARAARAFHSTLIARLHVGADEVSERSLKRLGQNGHIYLLTRIYPGEDPPYVLEFDSSGAFLRRIDVGSHPLLTRLGVVPSRVFWTDMAIDQRGTIYLSGTAVVGSPSRCHADFILTFAATGAPAMGIDTGYYRNVRMALDEQGSLYVYGDVDSDRADPEESYAIRKYDSSGAVVKKFGFNSNLFPGRGGLISVTTLSVRAGRIYLYTPETGCLSVIDEATGRVRSLVLLPQPPQLLVRQASDAGLLADPSQPIPRVEQRPLFVGPLKNGYFMAAIMETAYGLGKSLTINYCVIFTLDENRMSHVSVLHGLPAVDLQVTHTGDLVGFLMRPKASADGKALAEIECRMLALRDEELK